MTHLTKPQLMDRLPTKPTYMTTLGRRLSDGRCRSSMDSSVWLYRLVPLSPVDDAKDESAQLRAMDPLFNTYREMAGLVSATSNRRFVAKGSYRRTHALLVNVPEYFHLPWDDPLAEYLNGAFAHEPVDQRLLLFGVELKEQVGGGGVKKWRERWRDRADSMAAFIVDREIPMGDYEEDFQRVDAALSRAGLRAPKDTHFKVADAYWNKGLTPATPVLPHLEHLHVFHSPDAMRQADVIGVENCERLEALPGQGAVSYASVVDFGFDFDSPLSPRATWVSDLIGSGAIAVSVRGLVEPAKITRAELRRRRSEYVKDIDERVKQGKIDRPEQNEMLARLGAVEAHMAEGGANPTLIDASTLVAFSGMKDLAGFNSADHPVELAPMTLTQPAAMAETWLCSRVQANPRLHEIPVQVIAASGITGLSWAGDRRGAVLGLSERDRQLCRMAVEAASEGDDLPIFVCAAATGSGKLTTLDTRIITPTGSTTMGELTCGDQVIGRDGLPCTVTSMSDINPTPELYDVHLSDGQRIRVCVDHQWLVASTAGRTRKTKRYAHKAIANYAEAIELAEVLEHLADEAAPDNDVLLRLHELFDYLTVTLPRCPWRTPSGMYYALRMVEAPYVEQRAAYQVNRGGREVVKTDPVVTYNTAAALNRLAERWSILSGGNQVRWGARAARIAPVAAELAASVDADQRSTCPELARTIGRAAGEMVSVVTVSRLIRGMGLERRRERRPVRVLFPPTNHGEKDLQFYPLGLALKSLAARVRQQHPNVPTLEPTELVMSVGEMLAGGALFRPDGGCRLGIRVTEPLDLPERNLPVDPYALGAWLGDGSAGGGQLTSGTASSCIGPDTGITDQKHLIEQLRAAGVKASSHGEKMIGTCGLQSQLRMAGVLYQKHIPENYQRASKEQRLALLQGLMDTNGSAGFQGSCELGLSDERLATDALELIRSLGIKARMKTHSHTYLYKGERQEVKDRHRIHFTTTLPVFRLPRKARRLPTVLRETQRWLYITDITPVPSQPGRCITVDSPDSTYLVEGFVPTHNTMLMLNLADQWARMGHSGVVIDPKTGSDHSAAVKRSGGQIIRLDDITSADGIFDPIRFLPNDPEEAVLLATSLLTQISPWGGAQRRELMEQPLGVALRHGVAAGATCTGQALLIAQDEIGDKLPDGLVERVMETVKNYARASALIGTNPEAESLAVAKGITLIMVGNSHLDLPAEGQEPEGMNQRIALALMRMMVFGSSSALTVRGGGFVLLDEAWTFLGAGRSEIERLGRLARSQQVLPGLFSQRISDATRAGLAGYISRVCIGVLTDQTEARAACELAGMSPEKYLPRITRSGTLGGDSETGEIPDPESLKAMVDPETRAVMRGAIFYYKDRHGRVVPVENLLTGEFLAAASTNPLDITRRRAETAATDDPAALTGTERSQR